MGSKRGNWACPSCGRKTPNRLSRCEHCNLRRSNGTGSTYLGRHALARMGINLKKGVRVPVGLIKFGPAKKKEVEEDA